jgi:acyl carrier protein
MTNKEIEDLVIGAVRNINQAKEPSERLAETSDAPLFGPDSPLDSLGLVSLLMDVEEAISDRGLTISLSDARAMSRTSSPFRSVATLVDYIQESVGATL